MIKQMAASQWAGKGKLWLRDGLWVFSWLSHIATQQMLRISLSWCDPILHHVKGYDKTFSGLTLAVAPCLAMADMPLPVLAQILGSLHEIFFHWVHPIKYSREIWARSKVMIPCFQGRT